MSQPHPPVNHNHTSKRLTQRGTCGTLTEVPVTDGWSTIREAGTMRDSTVFQENEKRFERGMRQVERLQGTIELYEEETGTVPVDILTDYQDSVDSLSIFAERFGFSFDAEEYML